MKKAQMIEFVNQVYNKFVNARNHGNGNNWWYPKEYLIAYDVKMHSYADIESLRKVLTKKQNEFYSDELLQNIIWHEQEGSCENLIGGIKENFELEAHFAGRSGGWCEVQFSGDLDFCDKDTNMSQLRYWYHQAKELDKTEGKVAEYIKEAHANYNKYVDSKEYYSDIVGTLMTDAEIDDEYRRHIERLKGKIG